MISAVLENLDRTDLYERIFDYFGIEYDQSDEDVLAGLKQQDENKSKQSRRKQSLCKLQ